MLKNKYKIRFEEKTKEMTPEEFAAKVNSSKDPNFLKKALGAFSSGYDKIEKSKKGGPTLKTFFNEIVDFDSGAQRRTINPPLASKTLDFIKKPISPDSDSFAEEGAATAAIESKNSGKQAAKLFLLHAKIIDPDFGKDGISTKLKSAYQKLWEDSGNVA